MRRTFRVSVTTTRRLRVSGSATSLCRHCAAEAGGAMAEIDRLLASAGKELRELRCERHAIDEGEKR